MQYRYNGHAYSTIPCFNYEEAVKKIENGQIFRRDDLGLYYQKSNAQVKNSVSMIKNDDKSIFLLDLVCVTSVTTKHTYFICIEKSDNKNDTFYFDTKLENLILRELNLWGKTMNTEKLTGFGGKRFRSYLNAIPHEILSRKNFLNRAEKALSDGFKNREFKIEEAGIITDLAIKNLEKRRNTETANKEEANKKVAKLLKELG